MSSPATPRVLVLDADMVPGLTVARSLARRGCVVHVASHVEKPIAVYSRSVRDQFVYPSPLAMTADFLDWLSAHTQNHDYDLVIPVTERTLVPLSRSREQFTHVKIAMPSAESLDLVLDKSKTLSLARQLGVPIPAGISIDTLAELHASLEQVRYPVVIKPSRSIGSKDGGASHLQVSYAFEPSGLIASCNHALLFGGVVLQEYFGGIGVGIELIAQHGKIIYAFQHKRLHEVPLTGGGSSLRISESVNADLLQAARKLIKALEWNGVAMVEFKLNPATGEFCLMEINGRFWGSLPLAAAAGADFPSMLLDLELHGEANPCKPYKEGIVCRLLSRDLFWYEAVLRSEGDPRIVSIPSRSDVIKGLGVFLSPKHRFDVQSLVDPIPGLMDLGQILKSYYNRVRILIEERRFLSQQQRAWRRGEVAEAVAGAESMLFVCYGNINRSALADVMVRAYAEDTGLHVYSAGFHQETGRPSDPVMKEIASEGGLDMSAVRSTALTAEIIRKSDVVFVMEKKHYDTLLDMRPEMVGKVFLLGAHSRAGNGSPEIDDPYGLPREEYKRCYGRVSEAIDILKALLAMRGAV